MADLIDRTGLMADIEEAVVYSGRIGTNAEMRGANKITDRIKAAKAVDAVEVVRCKDCMWQGREDDCPLLSLTAYTDPNEYCSYGERKET